MTESIIELTKIILMIIGAGTVLTVVAVVIFFAPGGMDPEWKEDE